jgi:hypothetical protein
MFWWIIAGLLSVVAGILVFAYWYTKPSRDHTYNINQHIIFLRAANLLYEQAMEKDIPYEDTVKLLNMAVDVYNESLRGKTAEDCKMTYRYTVDRSDKDDPKIGVEDNSC